MAPFSVAFVCCPFMLAGSFVGARPKRVLPRQHLNSDAKDIVELGGLHEPAKR
jgi:hypothetical protein